MFIETLISKGRSCTALTRKIDTELYMQGYITVMKLILMTHDGMTLSDMTFRAEHHMMFSVTSRAR